MLMCRRSVIVGFMEWILFKLVRWTSSTRFALCMAMASSLCVVTLRGELTVLKSFGYPEACEEHPWAAVMEDNQGVLFGTSADGGIHQAGTVFRMNRDGTDHRILHHFFPADEGGGFPTASVVEGSDGLLYGTARGGDTVFRLEKDGSNFSVLHRFTPAPERPHEIFEPTTLLEGDDRVLYGITYHGGTSNRGSVYRLNRSGDGYQVLHSFTWSNGAHPGTLFEGSDGHLYGTCGLGGVFEKGTIFRLQKDGFGYTILRHMGAVTNDGASPLVSEGTDGVLYGTTYSGGASNRGTIFRIRKDGGDYQILHHFRSIPNDGSAPQGVIEAKDGKLYGHTRSAGILDGSGVVFSLEKNGSNYVVVRSLSRQDGYEPYSTLIQGSDGLLFGTTAAGGGPAGWGSGTVYSLRTNGSNFVVLRRFHPSGHDGMNPRGPLIEGTDGALYGTCSGGGASYSGTVFRLNKDGSQYRALHSFVDAILEGQLPLTSVIEGSDGQLYGTTSSGGLDSAWGTVFAIGKNGSGFSVLHHFTPNSTGDGGSPMTELVQGFDGKLYGTASIGVNSSGTLFVLGQEGSNYSVIHNFVHTEGPPGPVIKASDGRLYGVTGRGGGAGLGQVYRMNSDGSDVTGVHFFAGGTEDGAHPTDLLQGSDGKLYGTTVRGGELNAGVVFKMNIDGSEFSLLHSFRNDGWPTYLAQGRDGVLYGTTLEGGKEGRGSIYAVYRDSGYYRELYSFQARLNDGTYGVMYPRGVVQGSDGALYGATEWGGTLNFGIVFRFIVRPELSLVVQGDRTEIRARSTTDSLTIEASSDLSTWFEIASGRPTNGELFVESVAPLAPRFYRAVVNDD